MQNVLLVINLLACIALIVVVLLQRSEGGALGIGGGGGGGLISGRGAASALTRATMFFAAIFLISCIALTALASRERIRDIEDRSFIEGSGSLADDLETLETIDLGGDDTSSSTIETDDLGLPAPATPTPTETPENRETPGTP